MAKKTQKRAARNEKDRSGCMWGLLSMFDFRYGRSTRKLLADRKHGSKHAVGIQNSNRYEILAGMNEDFRGILDGEECKKTAIAATPSVKKLIDDELFGEKDVKKEKSKCEAEAKQSDSGYGDHSKTDQNKTTKTRKKSRDMDILDFSVAESLNSECSCNQHSETQSVNCLSIGKIMEELCHQIHQKSASYMKHDQDGKAHIQSIEDFSVFEDRFAKAINEVTGQKFNYGKDITEDQKMQHSREILDALKISRSCEELLVNLIQNPSSLLGKYVQDLQDAQTEKVEESESFEFSKAKESEDVVGYKQPNFFRRKAKLQAGNVPNENGRSEISNRIVILKPGPTGLGDFVVGNKVPNERISSHYFLAGIKRKLKHALGKERHGISTNSASNRVPLVVQNMRNDEKVVKENVGRNFQIKDHFPIERIARLSSIGGTKVDKTGKMKESEPSTEHETDNYHKKGTSNIYIEAKKHLSEILSSGDEGVEFLTGQKHKTLGRVISLPGYNYSPLTSPRSSAHGKPSNVNENIQSPARENTYSHIGPEKSHYGLDDVPAQNKDSNILEGTIDENKREVTVCPEGDVETVKAAETAARLEGSVTDAPSDLGVSSITIEDQYGDMSDACDDQGHSMCFKHESHEEIHFTPLSSPLAFPSGSPVVMKVGEYLESVSVSPQRPSPISVIEPLFSEDDISPDSTVSLPVGLPIQPLQIQFEAQDSSSTDQVHSRKTCMKDKQLIFDHVKRVLLTSGLNWKEFCVEWLSSEELLDGSLVDEVELFSNELCCDPKLLFDCITEVLPDICGQYAPWLLFVKHSVRPVPDLIGEEVYWHLLPLPRPRTLDQIIQKDMERTRSWLGLHLETEIIGIDTSEAILEELIEEITLNCACESPEAKFE